MQLSLAKGNLLKLFENIESKEDRLRDHQGGPQVCLAHIANQRKAKIELTNRALIGGDSGPVGPRANEMSVRKSGKTKPEHMLQYLSIVFVFVVIRPVKRF